VAAAVREAGVANADGRRSAEFRHLAMGTRRWPAARAGSGNAYERSISSIR